MNKKDLEVAVARDLKESAAYGKRVVDTVFRVIHDAVAAGEKVSVTGHGVYEAVTRPEHQGRNPATGQEMTVPEATVPKFRAGTLFKAKVASPPEGR